MSVKSVCPCVLVLMLVGVSSAQEPYSSAQPPSPAEAAAGPNGAAPAGLVGAPGRLSSYLTYYKPDCCGPLGGRTIGSELYFRTGGSVPIEGAFFDETLKAGWYVGGGARLLLFNESADAGWALDLGVSNIYNHGTRPDLSVPLQIFVPNPFGIGPPTRATVPSTVKDLNRTFFDFSLGREWYLEGNALNREGFNWRVGCDVGGRWGTAKLELHEIRHRTNVITGTFLSVHTDVEIPWGACLLIGGFRFEWDYTWMDDLIQQNDASLQDLNFLFNLGIRF